MKRLLLWFDRSSADDGSSTSEFVVAGWVRFGAGGEKRLAIDFHSFLIERSRTHTSAIGRLGEIERMSYEFSFSVRRTNCVGRWTDCVKGDARAEAHLESCSYLRRCLQRMELMQI
jgi:hypothetical protein